MSTQRKERTLLIIKPDGVQRALISECIKRFEAKCFKLIAIKMVIASEDLLKEHYSEHVHKSVFPSIIKYMTMGPVIPMVSTF